VTAPALPRPPGDDEALDGPAVVVAVDGGESAAVAGTGSVPRYRRPTSRRARADARRRALGTPTGVTGGGGPGGPKLGRATGRAWTARLTGRSSVAPMSGDQLRRRRTWVLGGMAAATVAGLGLSLVGFSVMRDSTAGRYVAPAVRPDEPGYQAYVISTPTLAVVQPDPDGGLAAVAVLSLRPGDDGGAVTLIPPSVRVPDVADDSSASSDDGDTSGAGDAEGEAGSRSSVTTGSAGDDGSAEPSDAGSADGATGAGDAATDRSAQADDTGSADDAPADGTVGSADADRSDDPDDDAETGTVADAYESGGAEAAIRAVSDVLDIAIDETVEVDDARWTALVEPVGPVTLTLSQGVGPYAAGELDLEAGAIGPFVSEPIAGEGELDRLAREAAFWQAWLGEVAAAGDGAVPGEVASGIGRFLLGLSQGPTAEVLPVTPADALGTTFERDDLRVSDLISRAVPYPLSPAPGRRVRVRLLNGTGDADLTAAVVPLLVRNGAEITIAGNASSFSVTETTYTYRTADDEAGAERLAQAVGVGSVEQDADVVAANEQAQAAEGTGLLEDEIEDEIDVTIVLGADVQDLIRRLENAG